MNHTELWDNCLSIIKDNVEVQSFKTWFEPIKPLKLEDNTLTIEVPSQFYYEWIEEHYVSLLKQTLRYFLGPDAKLTYSVIVSSEQKENAPASAGSLSVPTMSSEHDTKNPPVNFPIDDKKEVPNPFVIPGLKKVNIDPQLNPHYIFDSFIEGECNQMARTVGKSVAEHLTNTKFNPLFISGGIGLGKTHLVHAIGNEIKRLHADKVVLYVSSEKFINQFLDAIKNNDVSNFITFYQLIDVLIMDDVHFLAGKERTQDIFFHIFNHLHQNNGQIILTSDSAPNDHKGMQDRLTSRLLWGLQVNLEAPDQDTRMDILRHKMYREGIVIPDEVLEFLSFNIASNVRELEGAMIAILAQSSLNNREIDMELAREIVKTFVKNANREISIDSIQKIVSDYFEMPVEKLKEKTRKREIVQARQISMYFAKKYTKSSLKTIGLHFGGRDHSTVIHALNTVNDLMTTDRDFMQYVEDITKKIQLTTT